MASTAPAALVQVVFRTRVQALTYAVPPALLGRVAPGTPVRTTLRRQAVTGYVVAEGGGDDVSADKLVTLTGIDDDSPVLPPDLMRLVTFVADYYLAPVSEVLAAALPASERKAAKRYRLTELGRGVVALQGGGDQQALLELATRYPQGFSLVAVERRLKCGRKKAKAAVRSAVGKSWLEELTPKGRGPRKLAAYRRLPAAELGSLTEGQESVLAAIPVGAEVPAAQLAAQFKGAYAKLRSLCKRGLLERVEVEQRLQPHEFGAQPELPPDLTPEQQAVTDTLVAAVDEASYSVHALRGVTGSGKTEVYLRVIDHALRAGKTALVLVPEIALTPQLGQRFRARFGDEVAMFHSGLTVAERRDEWERVHNGTARVGLGARSALFLPLRDLGVIVVDEEHEGSFKQDETPRYHARDLAVLRARENNAIAILGSATPSLETHYKSTVGRYSGLQMPSRVHQRPLPKATAVSLAETPMVGDDIFSEPLALALERTLSRDEQSIVFLNRRGFAPYVYCRDCGHAFRCESCDVSLTLHRATDRLLCHYCAFEMMTPDQCPSCESHRLESKGLGTERVQEELVSLFGDVSVARLDRDTVRRRKDLEQTLDAFRRRETQILVGTQMLAKGHDFPGVTLVGVVAADSALHLPDFRASERTFQLLTQVSGRAGRGERPGSVVLQTYCPEHYAIDAALHHDYQSFAEQELEVRRQFGYPPYCHLGLVRVNAGDEVTGNAFAQALREQLDVAATRLSVALQVLGPAPAPLAKLQDRWRFQILLKGQDRQGMRQVLRSLRPKAPDDTRWNIDVDPLNML